MSRPERKWMKGQGPYRIKMPHSGRRGRPERKCEILVSSSGLIAKNSWGAWGFRGTAQECFRIPHLQKPRNPVSGIKDVSQVLRYILPYFPLGMGTGAALFHLVKAFTDHTLYDQNLHTIANWVLEISFLSLPGRSMQIPGEINNTMSM